MDREDLSKQVSVNEVGAGLKILRTKSKGKGSNSSKGLKVGVVCLACLKYSKVANTAGIEWVREEKQESTSYKAT